MERAPIGKSHLVFRRLGRSERKRRSLLFPGRRADRQVPHTRDGGQRVLRRPAAKPSIHLRLDVALRGIYERAGRYEAVTCQRSAAESRNWCRKIPQKNWSAIASP